jgi:hypothetical protein
MPGLLKTCRETALVLKRGRHPRRDYHDPLYLLRNSNEYTTIANNYEPT